MSKILITGATGHLGKATIEFLLRQGVHADQIVAFARDISKATYLTEKGIEVRIGSFDDRDSLDKATQGIETVLLVSGLDKNRLEQHKNVADLSKKNGVKRIVYTGVAIKDVDTSLNNPTMEDHFKTEEYISKNNLTYTFLRNSFYADAVKLFAGEHAIDSGIFLPTGDGKIPFAFRLDLAEATAKVLTQNGHENKTYELTGGAMYSFTDVANILSDLSGKTVTYTDADEKTYPDTLRLYGVPEPAIAILSGFSADVKRGQFAIESNDLERILERKPRDLKSVIKEVYSL
ncbi:SDR family oxidoreductase [Mucilaginibacter gossypii]|uniref:NAD(P)H dehydrogenase (Quinone) n=1 Tax=Mucilaginibacter gossypii TaxID=551996 RepID=A0A1G8CR58_9SPHI|nr:SDR family oxidoreductase [Mucilaginibacter gossypii]SDH47922.1 NAD(P)H dehydrogenase (quinone) [Mucilaginibacter gossypii]